MKDKKCSADSRQLLSGQHIYEASSPDSSFHCHHPRVFGNDFADYCGVFAQLMSPHSSQDALSIFGRHNGYDLAFIGNVKRVEAKNFTGAFHGFADGNGCFINSNPDSRLQGNFIQYAGHTPASRIPQNMNVGARL